MRKILIAFSVQLVTTVILASIGIWPYLIGAWSTVAYLATLKYLKYPGL